jgi:hypothetical protein
MARSLQRPSRTGAASRLSTARHCPPIAGSIHDGRTPKPHARSG